MIAAPIIPGKLYHVRYLGRTIEIVADHACRAIAIALDILLGEVKR
jgi:hypothetical protein